MILTIGTVAIDTVQTPFGKKENILGGSAVYFSIPASLIAPVSIVSIIGNDFPKEYIAYLKDRKIDIAGIQSKNEPTFRWDGHYLNDLNNAHTNHTLLGVLESFNPTLNEYQKKAPYIFLGNIDPDIQMNILKQLEQPQFIALDSMNYWVASKRDSILKVIKKIDTLILNESEIKQLAQESSTIKAAKDIQKMGPKRVIVKRGEYGSILISNDCTFSSMVFPTDTVKDPTGAGDSFAGGVISYLYSKISQNSQKNNYNELIKQSIIWGTAVASFTIEDFSVHGFNKITVDDILQRANQIHTLSNFNPLY